MREIDFCFVDRDSDIFNVNAEIRKKRNERRFHFGIFLDLLERVVHPKILIVVDYQVIYKKPKRHLDFWYRAEICSA